MTDHKAAAALIALVGFFATLAGYALDLMPAAPALAALFCFALSFFTALKD
jgi:hypothetical protein